MRTQSLRIDPQAQGRPFPNVAPLTRVRFQESALQLGEIPLLRLTQQAYVIQIARFTALQQSRQLAGGHFIGVNGANIAGLKPPQGMGSPSFLIMDRRGGANVKVNYEPVRQALRFRRLAFVGHLPKLGIRLGERHGMVNRYPRALQNSA